MIHAAGGHNTRVEAKTLDTVRWELAKVDVSDAMNFTDVLYCSARVIDGLRDRAEGRILAMRVRLVGATAAHGILADARDRVEAELWAHAVSHGDVFIERVHIATIGQLSAQAWAQLRDALGVCFERLKRRRVIMMRGETCEMNFFDLCRTSVLLCFVMKRLILPRYSQKLRACLKAVCSAPAWRTKHEV